MSDRTPADTLNAILHGDEPPCETGCTHVIADGWTALGMANVVGSRLAGYRVVLIPDDDTRDEVLNLVNRAKDRRTTHSMKKRYAIADDFDHVDLSRLERMADLLAAAYLDGQPQDRPATCPTCGSDDVSDEPVLTAREESALFAHAPIDLVDRYMRRCPDPWHTDGTGDTR